MVRGGGCPGGFCGACATYYRTKDNPKVRTCLACQVAVQDGMSFTLMPPFPARKATYDIQKLQDPKQDPKQDLFNLYPEAPLCQNCNVALRQLLDLYVCLRPVRWFKGVPSPVKRPDRVDMAIFRKNTEDIYFSIEFEAGTAGAKKVLDFLKDNFPDSYKEVRFPETSSVGFKSVSEEGTNRLVRAAIEYALANKRKSLTFVHKGNIMKFTEGAFRNWGYALAEKEFPTQTYTWEQWERTKAAKSEDAANAEQKVELAKGKILVKDAIADITLQQVLTRADEFDVIATLNLNDDYLSDALAAQVGGIGIAPGGNINYVTGHAIFEATHGTAPKYADQDKVNPGSMILSGEMMFCYMGWTEAADLIIKSLDSTIGDKIVTYDFARQMEDAKEVKYSEFGDALIAHM